MLNFFSESIALLIFACKTRFDKKVNHDKKDNHTWKISLLVIFPALIDIAVNAFACVALTMCAASVYQMVRGSIIVVSAIIALFYFKRKMYVHHFASLLIIIGGITLVGIINIQESNSLNEETNETDKTSILGILLLLACTTCAGSRYACEEKLMSKYDLDPLYVIGFEGFWGTIFTVAIIAVINFV